MNPLFQYSVLLTTGETRREKWNGREYLVIPAKSLKSMVLRGANNPAPAYLPESELVNSVPYWEGTEVTLDHPHNGETYVLVNSSPEIRQQYVIGQNRHVQYDGQFLVHEMWLDIERTNAVDDAVIPHFEAGKNASVSVGYLAREFQKSGEHHGQEYDLVQSDLIPDHIAVLLDADGACSQQDGCQLNVHVLSSARTPHYSGTESTDWSSVSKSLSTFIDAYYDQTGTTPPEEGKPSTVSGMSANMKSWIAQKTLLGETESNSVNDLIALPVVNPRTLRLNEGALDAVIRLAPRMEGVSESTINSATGMARRLLREEFDREFETERQTAESFAQAMLRGLHQAGISLQELFNGNKGEIKMDEKERQKTIDQLAQVEDLGLSTEQLNDRDCKELVAFRAYYLEDDPENATQTPEKSTQNKVDGKEAVPVEDKVTVEVDKATAEHLQQFDFEKAERALKAYEAQQQEAEEEAKQLRKTLVDKHGFETAEVEQYNLETLKTLKTRVEKPVPSYRRSGPKETQQEHDGPGSLQTYGAERENGEQD